MLFNGLLSNKSFPCLISWNRYQFDQVTEDAMVDRLSSFSLDDNNFEANATCSASGQTQTVTREAPTITQAPVH
ncbi:hypothetical protein V6Z11_A11G159600 [Gossypium hirsutum]